MLKSVSKLAVAGVLATAMAAAPLASAEARGWDHGNHGGNWNRGHVERHDNSGRNAAVALGILGGIIGLAALTSSHDHVVVREAPRPVYVVPAHRVTYAYPAPVYGRYAYRY